MAPKHSPSFRGHTLGSVLKMSTGTRPHRSDPQIPPSFIPCLNQRASLGRTVPASWSPWSIVVWTISIDFFFPEDTFTEHVQSWLSCPDAQDLVVGLWSAPSPHEWLLCCGRAHTSVFLCLRGLKWKVVVPVIFDASQAFNNAHEQSIVQVYHNPGTFLGGLSWSILPKQIGYPPNIYPRKVKTPVFIFPKSASLQNNVPLKSENSSFYFP